MSEVVDGAVGLLGLVARACGVTFVTCFFALVGAFGLGMLGEASGAPVGLVAVCVLAGMTLGTLTGLFLCVSFWKLSRLFVRGPVAAPPAEILRFATIAGGSEGLVFGAFYGGFAGAVVGGFIGAWFGRAMGASAWQVRQRTSIYLVAVAAGVLVEAGGCLLLGNVLRGVFVNQDLLLVAVLAAVTMGLLRWLYAPAVRSDEQVPGNEGEQWL